MREPAADWSALYLEARSREGRLLPDATVAALPDLPRGHPLADEWRQRADSASRLVVYVRRRPRPMTIVDLGCGNGWLTNRLAAIDGAAVVGVDVNAVELDQARRVFGDQPRLEFVPGDLTDGTLIADRPDVVVLASVIQYVPDPATVLAAIAAGLGPSGEIHVLDSPIYEPSAVAAARQRTQRHYAGLGVPEMAAHYFHHDWRVFDPLAAEVLYRPDTRWRRVERRARHRPRSPFPWIRIRSGARR
jgi:ubiquinone/menaquinone biosynthesis C-methylase UbiE